jgi:hypothetical protein
MRLSRGPRGARGSAGVKVVHLVVGVLAIALTGGATAWGTWCWWRVRQSRWFWILLRAGQATIVVELALGGVLTLLGHKPSDLHVLYGLLPVAISFVAEQLRIASAQMVLDARGFDSPEEVGGLAEADQRAVVIAILQRELGVMVLAAGVIVLLLARAAGTAG